MALAKGDHLCDEAQHLAILFGQGPVKPAQFVVLAVAVLFPRCVLRISSPARIMGRPGSKEDGHKVSGLLAAQGKNFGSFVTPSARSLN